MGSSTFPSDTLVVSWEETRGERGAGEGREELVIGRGGGGG